MTLSVLLMISAVTAAPGYQGVLLDFSATWCGPCQRVKPVVERLERAGFPIRTVDIDNEPGLAKRFRVNAVPTFVLVVNGKEVQRTSGPISEAGMRRLMARIPAAAVAASRTKEKEDVAPESLYAAPERKDASAERKRFQLPVSRNADAIAERQTAETVIRANNGDADRRHAGRVTNDPMVASVRIRVRDSQGINYGSGTVIDSRAGRSLVLTCGHIFRGVPKSAVIEVDRFEGKKATTHRGTIISFDLKADVGLMSIATDDPVPTVRLAPQNDGPQKGDALVSIGCGGGSRPLKIPVRLTGVNVYLGPGNLECTVMPKQGRSGGGLFDQSGRLVGVCFAAEPRKRRGLYASLEPIHSLLKKAGLQIRESKVDSPDTQIAAANSEGSRSGMTGAAAMSDRFAEADNRRGSFSDASAESGDESDDSRTPPRRELIQVDQRQLALMQVPLRRGSRQPPTSDETTSGPFPPTGSSDADGSAGTPRRESPLKRIDDVLGKSGEAEVVCVIRRLDDPRAPSKVIIINRASAKFVRYLQNETRLQPRKTSRFVENAADSAATLTSPFHMVGSESAASGSPARYRRSRASRLP